MHYVVFATIRAGMEQTRRSVSEAYRSYLQDRARHPDVTLHYGGPTLSEDGETVNGLLQVIEAPSLEAARAFVAASPYGQADLFLECRVRPWHWSTGRPGREPAP